MEGLGNLFNENFPNIGKDMDIQVQEAFRILNRYDQKKNLLYHITVKTSSLENKERILKSAKEKCLPTKAKYIIPLQKPKRQESMG
jgi:hypothetical protein